MKRRSMFASILLLAVLLVACSGSKTEPAVDRIDPGDVINGMTFTTDDQFDYDNDLNSYCGYERMEETDTSSYDECTAAAGNRLFFGNCLGIGKETTEELDLAWENLESPNITFDGQDLNLSAFGYLDFELPESELTARVVNAVVENISAGNHTIECGVVDEGVSYSNEWLFTVSE